MRKRYEMEEHERPFPFDFDARYRAEGWGDGIAWTAFGYETEPDEDTEWSGYENATGRVLAHMVGDDREYAFERDELHPLEDGAYCPECGQIGCRAYAGVA